MRRIVVSLLKGGVAKSETSVSLAHGLARAGHRVLLVDTDVQAQCSDMLGVHPAKGLAELIAGLGDPLELLVEARDNLWLLAGGNGLAGVKMEIARREMAPEAVLAEALEHYEGGFDYLIMDTAPGWDTLLVNALYCAREVLSPVSMEPMALSGLARFQERLAVIQKYNTQLQLRWIVPTFVDHRVKKSFEILAQLHERYGELVTPEVRYSVRLSEAPAFGKTIFEHDPKGMGAQGYQAVVERILADSPPAARPLAAVRVAPPERQAPPQPRPVPEPQPQAPPAPGPRPAAERQPEPAPPRPAAGPVDRPAAQPAPRPEPEREPALDAAAVSAPEPAFEPAVDRPEAEPAGRTVAFAARRSLRERLARAQERLTKPDPGYRDIRERFKDGRA
jgi:chromosome partitioning protein